MYFEYIEYIKYKLVIFVTITKTTIKKVEHHLSFKQYLSDDSSCQFELLLITVCFLVFPLPHNYVHTFWYFPLSPHLLHTLWIPLNLSYFHCILFFDFFSISPIPSKTFVISYILLFCLTANWSAA